MSGPFQAACRRLDSRRFAAALWSRQLDVWTDDRAAQRAIANRLGWLDALQVTTSALAELRESADAVRRDGFTDIVLFGMGGSSLAPEVLRQVFGSTRGWPRFRVLDSVDPEALERVFDRVGSTLFILASKSGSTIEPNALGAEAIRRVVAAGYAEWGSRFIAITDADTPLHRRAGTERFRRVFVNPFDIGGRYSALSLFGMVPAALMGLHVETLLERAREMDAACRLERASENPGLALGAFMAAGREAGRDKLTLVLPPKLQAMGLWIEQLVAESTGKRGLGIVPVTDAAQARSWKDRIAIVVSVGAETPPSLGRLVNERVPHIAIELPSLSSLGAEMLRWEVATATAGFLMGINPFDEPDVQQAKDATRALLDLYGRTRRLPLPDADARLEGATLISTDAAKTALSGEAVSSFLQLIRTGDYFALLAFLPPDDPRWHGAFTQFLAAVEARTGCATTLGFGPRYLHSTGQLHKGGQPTGVFLILVADSSHDLAVPGESYSFGVLEMAQALGDFQALDRASRRALLVRLPERSADAFKRVTGALLGATVESAPQS